MPDYQRRSCGIDADVIARWVGRGLILCIGLCEDSCVLSAHPSNVGTPSLLSLPEEIGLFNGMASGYLRKVASKLDVGVAWLAMRQCT